MVPVRRWRAASLVVVAALYAGATGSWAVACSAALVVVTALAFGARARLGPASSRLVAAIAAAVGAGIGWAFPSTTLRAPWPSFALAGIFAGAGFLCRSETGRSAAAMLLPGLVALTACGEAPLGWVYAVVVVTHLAFALLALRAATRDDLRASHRLRLRPVLRVALLATIAAAIAAGFAVVLPPLDTLFQNRILHALGMADPEVGFSDRLALGSLHGLAQSEEVVMHIEGPRPDYLRGAVFNHYDGGRWSRHGRPTLHELRPSEPRDEPGRERTLIRVAGGLRDRLFVPLGAHAIDPAPRTLVDDFGVLRASGATSVSFEASGAPDAPPIDPTADDLDVPPRMRATLLELAQEWSRGATTPEARATAIADHLRTRFTYALEFDHQRRRDPLLDFLLDDHRGHCEYFASALTLIARAAGIPARVATGYRVAEQNALLGTWIVRERNAHAWSEIYLPERGFVTFDATPEGATAANTIHHESLGAALLEMVQVAGARAMTEMTLPRAFAVVAMGGVALLVIRLRRARAGKTVGGARGMRVEPTPPSLARLLAACGARGIAHASWEPLERFAARLQDRARSATERAAAELVERWAAHRYGGVGAEEDLARETEACVKALRAEKITTY